MNVDGGDGGLGGGGGVDNDDDCDTAVTLITLLMCYVYIWLKVYIWKLTQSYVTGLTVTSLEHCWLTMFDKLCIPLCLYVQVV